MLISYKTTAMITLLILFLFLNPIIDSQGVSGEITGVHIEKEMTYVQVTYKTGKWGVYFLPEVTDSYEKVVSTGTLLNEKSGLQLFPLSDTWQYVKQKEYVSYTKSH